MFDRAYGRFRREKEVCLSVVFGQSESAETSSAPHQCLIPLTQLLTAML